MEGFTDMFTYQASRKVTILVMDSCPKLKGRELSETVNTRIVTWLDFLRVSRDEQMRTSATKMTKMQNTKHEDSIE